MSMIHVKGFSLDFVPAGEPVVGPRYTGSGTVPGIFIFIDLLNTSQISVF
jgi:hypothetical protein